MHAVRLLRPALKLGGICAEQEPGWPADMNRRTLHPAALGLLAGLLGALAAAPGAGAAATVSPLPESDYGVKAACRAPSPRHASCLALQLVPRTAAAKARKHPLGVTRAPVVAAPSPAAGSYGLRPQDLHSAYQLPTSASGAQTIAIVDAYNDPTVESDLEGYDEPFALAPCTTGNGCFARVNQKGESSPLPFPVSTAALEAARKGTPTEQERAEEATGWDLEISLDVETARAVCQSCKILLVEAKSSSYEDLEAAERTAASLGAQEISNSWGGPEGEVTPAEEEASAFDHPGIVITSSAGDSGYLDWDSEFERGFAEFPASSPHVVSVGGTRLSVEAGGGWAGETVWNGSGAGGGGCSVDFEAPAWQQEASGWSSVGCTNKRAVADVAADADPYTGLAVHDTSPICEHTYEEEKVKHVANWCTIGGTSLASPLIASVFALASGAGGAPYPARTLYQNAVAKPTSLHDVTTGSNGECLLGFDEETGLSGCTPAEEAATSCSSHAICLARTGYDGPTGVGTPHGIAAFVPPPEEKSGGGGGGGGGTGGGTGGGSGQGNPPGPVGTPNPPAGPPAPVSSPTPPAILLSGLALTRKSIVALNRSRPRLAQIAFAFTISTQARVRVTLSKRVRRNGRGVWRALPSKPMFTALRGRNSARLVGRGILGRGSYLLTLAPTGGAAHSLQFQIG